MSIQPGSLHPVTGHSEPESEPTWRARRRIIYGAKFCKEIGMLGFRVSSLNIRSCGRALRVVDPLEGLGRFTVALKAIVSKNRRSRINLIEKYVPDGTQGRESDLTEIVVSSQLDRASSASRYLCSIAKKPQLFRCVRM